MKPNTLKSVVLLAAFFVSIAVMSHEFWLQPLKFKPGVNETTMVDIFVGEGYKGEKSDGTKYKITQLNHYAGTAVTDIRNNILSKDLSRFTVKFASAGNHLVAFNNTNKSIGLEAAEFNAYLREEGLDDVFAMRAAKNDTLKAGREMYQRCAKTLFQVGGKNDDNYKINTGMRLEIIPQNNPYLINTSGELAVTVLFENKPVNNALVLAWNVQNGKTTVTKIRSDASGNAVFKIIPKGRWMISTVKMVPHTNPAEADWQSYWGSYTFGF